MAEYNADEFFHHKRTNADRIRKMSDEELADGIFRCLCPPERFCGTDECKNFKWCRDCFLDWLKQEVDDGGSD